MGKNWAIAVGINDYYNLQPLHYAVQDAEFMRDFFLSQPIPFEQVYYFSDHSPEIETPRGPMRSLPTYANLKRFLRERFQQPFLEMGDNFWFFFAGHGELHEGHDYLMPIDADPGNVEETALRIGDITAYLRNSGADNVILLLDACRSQGKRGQGFGSEEQAGMVTIYSCRPREASYEIDELQHGSFTYALLEGLHLQGVQNCATVERLDQYLRYQVPDLNQRHGKPRQTPYTAVEPISKNHLILLPHQSTLLADVQALKNAAFEAETEQNILLAEQLWIRVLAVSPADQQAIKAIKRLAQQAIATPPTQPVPPSPVTPSPVIPDGSDAPRPVKVFISYSHKDEDLREELDVHLANLKRQGKIEAWHDRAIEAGTEWDATIKQQLETAEVILLLISPRFIASDYCYDLEMQRAIERHEQGTVRVIPIILKPCDWQDSPFSKLQVLPKDARPVTQWSDQDEAFLNVVQGIRRAVDSLQQTPFSTVSGARKPEVVPEPPLSSPSSPSSSSPPHSPTFPTPSPTFEFEVITLEVKRSSGPLGLSQKAKFLTYRRPGRAEYRIEDLGNGIFLELVSIPGGTFLMGSPVAEPDRSTNEGPQHQVTVKPFWMGKFPVTQVQWRAVADLPKINHDLNPEPSKFEGDYRPVEQVSWHMAVEFCNRLFQKTGHKYRLPSEAEWEYGCRAGTTTPYHFGETITLNLVNYNGKSSFASLQQGLCREQTTDVGSFPPNAFGLYDMHGNVREWCLDHWHENHEGAPTDGNVWLSDNENSKRLIRNGSWFSSLRLCRSAYRYYASPDDRRSDFGFRVVCSAPRIL